MTLIIFPWIYLTPNHGDVATSASPPPTRLSAATAGTDTATALPSSLDLSVPTSPALDVLGLSASKVVQASSLQQVAWSIVTGSDETGNSQQGIAYTANPTQLKLITKTQLFSYYYKPDNILQRAWYNTQFSVAATQASNDPQAISHAACGISIPLLDETDWRTNIKLTQEFAAKVKSQNLLPPQFAAMNTSVTEDKPAYVFTKMEETQLQHSASSDLTPQEVKVKLSSLVTEADSFLSELVKERPDVAGPVAAMTMSSIANEKYQQLCKDVNAVQVTYIDDTDKTRWAAVQKIVADLNNDSWNNEKLDLAGGALTQDAGTGAFKSTAYGAWADYSHPLGHYAQGLVYGKYENGLYTTIASMKTPAIINGAYAVAGRVRGGSPKDGFFAEFQYLQGKPSGGATLYSRTFQLGWEHKLGDQWLEFAIGQDLANEHKFIFGLNFAINTSPKQLLTNQGTPRHPHRAWAKVRPDAVIAGRIRYRVVNFDDRAI